MYLLKNTINSIENILHNLNDEHISLEILEKTMIGTNICIIKYIFKLNICVKYIYKYIYK